MPENIFKLYRGKPNKPGERKGPGSWHNEPESSRFNHIYDALSRYCDNTNNDYDFLDLVWHIKNAVVGDIYFSDEVYNGIMKGQLWNKYINTDGHSIQKKNNKETDQFNIIEGIINRTTLRADGVFDDTFLEIRKWLGSKVSGGSLIFEHIIPANIYLEELINAFSTYKNRKKEFETWFDEFRKKIAVCIVTKDENDLLNKWHHSMPDEYKSGNIFARYDDAEVNVRIHGRSTSPRKHNYNFEHNFKE